MVAEGLWLMQWRTEKKHIEIDSMLLKMKPSGLSKYFQKKCDFSHLSPIRTKTVESASHHFRLSGIFFQKNKRDSIFSEKCNGNFHNAGGWVNAKNNGRLFSREMLQG